LIEKVNFVWDQPKLAANRFQVSITKSPQHYILDLFGIITSTSKIHLCLLDGDLGLEIFSPWIPSADAFTAF